AIVVLFSHSPLFLLSVMAIVWVADIGAYFSGKAFGKRKLAPSISPGKSWEGAIGGGIAVLVLAALSVQFGGAAFADTFAARVANTLGWPVLVAVLVLMVAASIVGDLFESQLKRRAGMKDSSSLLPGHGGVLDRIDALIPVLPLAALIGSRL
ncbi:MAG: phosphatidate cytidylyltransferase, partial [Ramlibacter sp.]